MYPADKIRITTPSDVAHFTMHLAQRRGFLKEERFDAELIVIYGPVANIALSNGAGTIPVLMATYRIDKDVATAAYDSFIKGFNLDGSMPEDGFRRLLDDTKRLMKIDREVALSEVADLSILREAQRELGVKGK